MKLKGTEFYLSKKVGKAITDYQMLSDGDRIAGRLTVIRPLAYIEERQTARFARAVKLPCYKYSCKNSLTSNRKKISKIINDLEKICPNIKINIFRSIKKIKKDYLL